MSNSIFSRQKRKFKSTQKRHSSVKYRRKLKRFTFRENKGKNRWDSISISDIQFRLRTT